MQRSSDPNGPNRSCPALVIVRRFSDDPDRAAAALARLLAARPVEPTKAPVAGEVPR